MMANPNKVSKGYSPIIMLLCALLFQPLGASSSVMSTSYPYLIFEYYTLIAF